MIRQGYPAVNGGVTPRAPRLRLPAVVDSFDGLPDPPGAVCAPAGHHRPALLRSPVLEAKKQRRAIARSTAAMSSQRYLRGNRLVTIRPCGALVSDGRTPTTSATGARIQKIHAPVWSSSAVQTHPR